MLAYIIQYITNVFDFESRFAKTYHTDHPDIPCNAGNKYSNKKLTKEGK